MDRPIFLIGAARSGTTVLAEVLAAHRDVAFWNEPRYVWRHGNHAARDDRRSADEATPAVAAWIRRRFEEHVARSGRSRFLEKTPSNCFRVAFMHRVFPEGLFLHLQRDGRDVAASALRRWCSAPDDRAILRRVRGFEIPVMALHHYAPEILRELVMRRLQPSRGHLWGPRYPGIHEDLRAGRPIEEVCALQWAASARAAATDLAGIPARRQLTLRYESLVRHPEATIQEICRFAGLAESEAVRHVAAQVLSSERIGGFLRLPEEQRERIEAVCAPVIAELGLS